MSTPREVAAAIAVGAIFLAALWVVTGVAIIGAPHRAGRGGDVTIDHGTRRGFQQHKAIGSAVCGPCEDANRTYMREYMRANYDPAKRRAAYHRRLATWGHP